MYERLTKRFLGSNAPYTEFADYNEIINRLCDLEDKIEQGKILELPCEIGETVYHITTCEGFTHELDGSLYDSFGGLGDATGYYCPCELRDNCPFDNEEDFDCDKLKTKQAVFEDEVKGILLGECEYDNVVFLGYSGNVYFHEFGKTVFFDRASAEAKVREMEGDNDE